LRQLELGMPSPASSQMNPADLLRSAIEASGLSARRFATDVLLRDERTVRRWLAGDSPIPEVVISWLKENAK
jgi:hypothetical protein